jgi:pyridoxal phosphate enzyme (YggS family)
LRICDNIKRIRDMIAQAALRAGRNPDEIKLIAASKAKTPELIREAVAAGVDAVGENRVQEMVSKISQGAYEGTPLHFIGHLQKNKVKHVVGQCDLIQSVDSLELIKLIDKRAKMYGICQDILLQVNIGKEPQKKGFLPEQIEEIIDLAKTYTGINIKGLMAIPPIALKKGDNRIYFEKMNKLYVDIKQKRYDNIHMNYLSLGMSGDFTDAIISGSNMVRIGTAIFGSRV